MTTILLVDDDPTVLRVAQLTLEAGDYRVIAANNAQDARDRFRERRDDLDLMVFDVAMPDVTGPTLAREFLAQKPGIPVLLMSGFITETELKEIRFRFIAKPFLPSDLLSTVREVLRTPRREETAAR